MEEDPQAWLTRFHRLLRRHRHVLIDGDHWHSRDGQDRIVLRKSGDVLAALCEAMKWIAAPGGEATVRRLGDSAGTAQLGQNAARCRLSPSFVELLLLLFRGLLEPPTTRLDILAARAILETVPGGVPGSRDVCALEYYYFRFFPAVQKTLAAAQRAHTHRSEELQQDWCWCQLMEVQTLMAKEVDALPPSWWRDSAGEDRSHPPSVEWRKKIRICFTQEELPAPRFGRQGIQASWAELYAGYLHAYAKTRLLEPLTYRLQTLFASRRGLLGNVALLPLERCAESIKAENARNGGPPLIEVVECEIIFDDIPALMDGYRCLLADAGDDILGTSNSFVADAASADEPRSITVSLNFSHLAVKVQLILKPCWTLSAQVKRLEALDNYFEEREALEAKMEVASLQDEDDLKVEGSETRRKPKSTGAPGLWTLQDARAYAEGRLHPNLRFLLFDSTGCDPRELHCTIQKAPSLKEGLSCSLGLSRPTSAKTTSSRPMSAGRSLSLATSRPVSASSRPLSARKHKGSLRSSPSRPASASASRRPSSAGRRQSNDLNVSQLPTSGIVAEMSVPQGRVQVMGLLARQFLCWCPSGLPCVGDHPKIQAEEVNTENLGRWATAAGHIFKEAGQVSDGVVIFKECYMYEEPIFIIRDQLLRHYRGALGELKSKLCKEITDKCINKEQLESLAVTMEAFEFEFRKQHKQILEDAAGGLQHMLKLARAAATLRTRQAAAAAPGRAAIHENMLEVLESLLQAVAKIRVVSSRGLGSRCHYDARILRATEQEHVASVESCFVAPPENLTASQSFTKIVDKLLTLACRRDQNTPSADLLSDTELMGVLIEFDASARRAEHRLIAHAI